MSFKKSSGRVLLPFGLDYSDVLSQGQTIEKPQLELPVHGPLGPYELNAAKQALAFLKLMLDGPFFTGNAENSSEQKAAEPILRYLDKYKKVKKVGRSIDEYPYQVEFFPEELYSVMGISKKKKKLLLSSYKADGGLAEFTHTETEQLMLEKLKSLAEDLDANPAAQNEEEPEEEDFDDEFEEDDDDDYNAEKYFDGGDDDMGDDGDDEAAF